MLNRLVLVLNASYEPVTVISARRSMTLLSKGAAVIEDGSGFFIKTPKAEYPMPSVIRLVKYRRVPRLTRQVSRKGILLRDNHTCQYCGVKMQAGELTLDHIQPRSRGGANTWENLVTSCFPCNNKKGHRTPEEAGMKLLSRPIPINIHTKHRLMGRDYDKWTKYLFIDSKYGAVEESA